MKIIIAKIFYFFRGKFRNSAFRPTIQKSESEETQKSRISSYNSKKQIRGKFRNLAFRPTIQKSKSEETQEFRISSYNSKKQVRGKFRNPAFRPTIQKSKSEENSGIPHFVLQLKKVSQMRKGKSALSSDTANKRQETKARNKGKKQRQATKASTTKNKHTGNNQKKKEGKSMQELKQLLAQEEQKLQKIVKEMERALQNVPEGRLRISKRGNQTYYYHCTNAADDIHHNGKYLRKNQLQLARELAQKEYNKKVLEVSVHRMEELRKFQKSIDGIAQIQEIYTSLDAARQKLLIPAILPDKEYAEKWEAVEYPKKLFKEDAPEIYTDKGERVRSKSEKILADRFYRMDIPYRYEYPLYLNENRVFHPDFTLLNKRTRKEYYWEHCGMMDNPNYCNDMVSRMGIYAKNGIIQGKQLIVTYETLETPLNQKMIDEYINTFLC